MNHDLQLKLAHAHDRLARAAKAHDEAIAAVVKTHARVLEVQDQINMIHSQDCANIMAEVLK